MLNAASIATYSKISQMTSNINSFITQAIIAKSQITTSMNATLSNQALYGIGQNVDMFA